MPIWNFSATPKENSCNPSFLKLENGIPSHDTFSRLLSMLDPAAFRQWFTGFMQQFAAGGGDAGVLGSGRENFAPFSRPAGQSNAPRCIRLAPGPRRSGWC